MDAQKVEALKDSAESILIIQTAFPGDAILTLPMIERLKDRHPDGKIDVLAIPSTEEIFKASPYVNEVIVLDKKGRHKSIRKLNSIISELKSKSYSEVYSPHRSLRSAYITLCLKAPESYGFDSSSFKYAFKNVVKYEPKHHEVQRNFALIGEKPDGTEWKVLPKIYNREEDKKEVSRVLSENNVKDKFITIAPGSVWNTKRYPKEFFSELIELLSVNETVILIGSESDKLLCNEIAENSNKNVINLAGQFSIPVTILLLKHSKLLITNDSAPAHMGVCADIPVLTIYCSTIPGFGFYPYNKKSNFISYDELYCKPCGIHGYRECPVKNFDCAFKLLPDKIFSETQNLLSRNKNGI